MIKAIINQFKGAMDAYHRHLPVVFAMTVAIGFLVICQWAIELILFLIKTRFISI